MQKFVYSFLFLVLSVHNTLAQNIEPRLIFPLGHSDDINSAIYSRDGKLILTTSCYKTALEPGDNTVRVWDSETGKLLNIIHGQKRNGFLEGIKSAYFSLDGKRILISEGNTAFICDAQTSEKLQFFIGHQDAVRTSVFSNDEKLVLTASDDNTARIYEVLTGRELNILKGHTNEVYSAVFSSDDKLVLTASKDNTCRIYEVSTGKELHILLNVNSNWIKNSVFSPDGKLALTSSGDVELINLYDVSTGKLLRALKGKSAVFSPNNKSLLITYEDKKVKIIDIDSGFEQEIYKFNSNNVYSAVFSPDGNLAAVVEDTMVSIHNANSGDEIKVLKCRSNKFNYPVFSPDSRKLLLFNKNTIQIWDTKSAVKLQTLNGKTLFTSSAEFSPYNSEILTASFSIKSRFLDDEFSADFSSDGNLLLSMVGTSVQIKNIKTGKKLFEISEFKETIYSSIFSIDNKYVITASGDKTARIWDSNSGKEIQVIKGHTDNVYSAELSPDNKFVLTSSHDGTARLFDAESGNELLVFKGHKNPIYSAKFSHDGKLALTASWDSTARIWDVATGKELQVLRGHTDWVNSAVFSREGKLALTISSDNTARIWDVATGQELRVLGGHTHWISSAEFSADSKLSLTASFDNTVRIYEVATGKELQVLIGHTDWVNSAVFSPNYKYVVTTGYDYKTILWNVETGKPLYTRLQLENNDWLVYDEDYRFDGTPGAIDYLYLTCGLEVIDLAQVKDSLWVPGLVEKIMNGDSIMINDRPAPKLKDLNICELTPVIEPIENGDKGLYRYKIIPRNGGLGETEVYINGNLTYKFKPEQLQKKLEQKKEVYYLSFSSDTLQGFLTGEKNTTNPILVKAKVKGSGIYGRGVILDLVKNTEKESPKFYGLFIGVNDYGNPNKESSEQRYRDLDFAKKDADDLSNAVEATARNLFKEDCHIYRLTETGNSENAPTKANIQKALKEIGEKAKASDILYIFFAGHGDIPEKSGEKEIRFILHKADKKNLMSSSFGVDELTDWCHPKNIKAQKRVFVFDACHSGQLINQTMAFNGRGDDEATRIRQLDKLKDKNGMMILAAAADNESAYEDETINQGVLTYHLLQVMKEQQKDTSLVIRSWFDETIDLVKDYSRANGNKQEPNSFGDGRFEIGNITNEVRQKIDISCPKTRIGMCDITMNLDAKAIYPQLRQKVNNYFTSPSARGDFVFSKNLDKSYRVVAACNVSKKKVEMYYDIFLADQQIGNTIILPKVKNKTEENLVQIFTESITAEIERIDKRKERCKLKD